MTAEGQKRQVTVARFERGPDITTKKHLGKDFFFAAPLVRLPSFGDDTHVEEIIIISSKCREQSGHCEARLRRYGSLASRGPT